MSCAAAAFGGSMGARLSRNAAKCCGHNSRSKTQARKVKMIQSLIAPWQPLESSSHPGSQPGCTLDPSRTADESCSKPKLLDGILAGQQLRGDDADGREHGEAA
eukprot:CAMPEP_0204144072 /NCGR_PEP_ID=MMETSP0361-20130328/20863_1 /ASSEMBLY_ACC=CAM_ASM_000343 /TAXON_ID=268821 /ORGANISM="Scrippsiella Hangoei, Strain SHTV-5" /LENGTH=103 /DNA_ID=CAMNT_0051098009 /DNA_START=109 /DNA_END=418 /DNA_ORIENTATION=+